MLDTTAVDHSSRIETHPWHSTPRFQAALERDPSIFPPGLDQQDPGNLLSSYERMIALSRSDHDRRVLFAKALEVDGAAP